MGRVLLALALASGAGTALAAPTEILPAGDLAPGMRGYGLSDFGDGKGVQRFDVEIVGPLKSYAPRQDLILARILSDALDRTGIIAGMSGSPVYVNGKLIGALAYGWPFSREAICGITPIQSMLDIRKAPASPPVPIGGAATRAAAFVAAFRDRRFEEPLASLWKPLGAEPAASGPSPLPLPVSLSGAARPGGCSGGSRRRQDGWSLLPALRGRRPPGGRSRGTRVGWSRVRRSRPCCCRETWFFRQPAR